MAGRRNAQVRRPKAKAREVDSATGYHHGNLREALLQGALELIGLRGAAQLSLREVARRIGVSHAAPYRHFADKNALLGVIALQGFSLLKQALEESRIDRGPREAFEESGRAYVRFALAHPAHLAVMFGGGALDPAACDGLPERGEDAFGVLVAIIETAQEAGVVRPGDSRTLALAAWSLVHGLALLVREGGAVPPAGADQTTRALTQILFEGMRAQDS